MTKFEVNLEGETQPFNHFWKHTVGSGNATLALRKDWQEQLKRVRDELGFERVRFHGILSGQMYTFSGKDDGKPEDSFFNADQIIDYLLEIGMQPFIELSFMPESMASGTKTHFSYNANVTTPKDYGVWKEYIAKLVRHWIERYGNEEVSSWYFEVWNEPNFKYFWTAGQKEYFKLYKYTAEGIVNVAKDHKPKIGGPVSSEVDWIEEMLDFASKEKLPLDFVSTHNYPNDPYADSVWEVDKQLTEVPLDIMRQNAIKAKEEAGDLPVLFTEWNISSKLHYHLNDTSYSAAFIVNTIMDVKDYVDAYSFWVFSDIFTELGFSSLPFQGGFGLLTIHNIAKPSYRAFQFLGSLGNEMLKVAGKHKTVRAFATKKKKEAVILITNYAQPLHEINEEIVQLEISSLKKPSAVSIMRIDENNANAYKEWEEMGEPKYPTTGQVQQLQLASEVVKEFVEYTYNDNKITVDFKALPYSVARIGIHFEKTFDGQYKKVHTLFAKSDAEILDDLQKKSYMYFEKHTNDSNGLVKDRSDKGSPASISASGKAICVRIVGVENGFIARESGAKTTINLFKFLLEKNPGKNGFYYHFLDPVTGKRTYNSEVSSIDSGCLFISILCALEYFDKNTVVERELRDLGERLLRKIDWKWMTNRTKALSMGWKPRKGFLDHLWLGYNEALFLYIIALGVGKNTLSSDCYDAWTKTYRWEKAYNYEYLYSGPLFTHQYSHMWIDFRGIQDKFMRKKHSDYFENSRTATYIDQLYAIRNPHAYKDYGELFWGLSATAGPGPDMHWVEGIARCFFGYVARGVPYGPDDGTIAPSVVLGSLPFAPEIVIPTVKNIINLYPQTLHETGLCEALNPMYRAIRPKFKEWVSDMQFAISQSPIVMMVENYKSGLFWDLTKRSKYIRTGLLQAGFKGGWLDE